MELILLLEFGKELLPLEALGSGDALKHVLDARHHSLEAAEVDVGAVLQEVEDLCNKEDKD